MSNSNYGYQPSAYTSPYSSTQSNVRPYRPLLGFSGPPFYSRTSSSTDKAIPDSFSDTTTNNFGNSTSRGDNFNPDAGNDSYNNSYKNDSSANYYNANDNYYPEQSSDNASMPSAARSDMGYMRENSQLYGNKSPMHADAFAQNRFSYSNASLGLNSNAGFQQQYSSPFGQGNRQPFFARGMRRFQRRGGMAAGSRKLALSLKCKVCNLDFTSQVPYDMHIGGARHAKKVKANKASTDVAAPAVKGGEKELFCSLCNVKANSLLQYQMHFEGTKHKKKLNPKEPNTEDQVKKKKKKASALTEVTSDLTEVPSALTEVPLPPAKKKKKGKKASAASANEKTNGSLTRSLPSDFGEPQPAKLMKFSCDICSVSVNSDLQLQQHLSSKKHQNKVEGKTEVKVKKDKAEIKEPVIESMET